MGAAATATASASASTASGSPAPHYTKYIDAFHSQLLVDVQAIGDAVDQHVTALPLAYAEFDERARGISGAASKATTDFEAMGVALLNIIKTRTDRMRTDSVATSAQVAEKTKSSLEVFTRYFWLLIGMSAFNFIALATCTIVLFMKRTL